MGDSDSKPVSIERCRELLGTENSGLSDEEIKQFGFRPTRGHTYSSTSISINSGKNGLAKSRQMKAVRSLGLVRKSISFEINVLTETEFQPIQPLNLRAAGLPTVAQGLSWKVHLRSRTIRRATVDNLRLIMERRLVDQNSASWNHVVLWMRKLGSLRRVG